MTRSTDNSGPGLIAHRGYSSKYPENTLLALEEAFKCGACYVECDVQLTKDRTPILLHDNSLNRAAGLPLNVHDLEYKELKKISAAYKEKFADRYIQEKIPLLEEFVSFIKRWPSRVAFVEIKRSSIRKFGVDLTFQEIKSLLSSVINQVVVISFDDAIIRQFIKEGGWKTGWVVEHWTDKILEKVNELGPDYFFVDHECLPAEFSSFQQSGWRWVLYEVDDPVAASQYVQQGVNFIETNDICALLRSEIFAGSGCS